MNHVYQVGNTHLSYYDDVMDYFANRGFEADGSEVVTVGANLIGWYLKDRYPEAEVETVEVEGRTAEIQNRIGERLSEGCRPSWLQEEVETRDLLEPGEDSGVIYPEIVSEIGNDVAEPDSSFVGCFSDYEGEADLVISNNVGDFMGRERMIRAAAGTGAEYFEMYSTTIAPEDVIGNVARSVEFDPDFDPDIDFWWAPEEEVTLALFS